MNRATWILAALVLLGGTLSSAKAGPIGFSGDYAPGNWSTTLDNSNGSVDTSQAPTSITVIGSNNNNLNEGHTDFTIRIPFGGTVTFDWNYQTTDTNGPDYDPFGYLLNGTFHQLTNDSGPNPQSGSKSVPVSVGDVFGFRAHTDDNIFGNAQATISNFDAPVKPQQGGSGSDPVTTPEPASIVLFGVAGIAVGYCGWRRRKRLAAA